MVVNKRKKNSRQRGQWTHGWGAKKKHRGAGNRGGRGNAGSGKRGDAKSPIYVRKKNYFGKHGFTSHAPAAQASRRAATAHHARSINIGYLDTHADLLVRKGLMSKSGDTYSVDLSALKAGKLLGAGSVSRKFTITALYASARAVEKVSAKGGSVTTTRAPAQAGDDATADADE